MSLQPPFKKQRSDETLQLLLTRRSLSANRQTAPGPDADEITLILRCATRVPDHGKLTPWRIKVVQGEGQTRLAQLIGDTFKQKNPDATPEMLAVEYGRALRSPLLLIISTKIESDRMPRWEQILSGAAVCQNAVIAANALGYFAHWLTEWYSYDPDVKAALGIAPGDEVLGFIHIGSGLEIPAERARPALEDVVEFWG